MNWRACSLLVLLSLCTHELFVWATITSYVALGDSYPAGDGAGSSKLLPNPLCGRFDGAYPYVIANSTRLHIGPFDFENVACGGATTSSVTKTQLRKAKHYDMVTIQVGGNEVDWFMLINECVFQWRQFSSCEKELTRVRGLIQATNFIAAFDRMVATAANEADDGTKILMLGYARFFNDQSRQCNGVSFSKTDPSNLLSQTLRASLNELLTMLNNVIKASAEAHGAMFIDIDPLFSGHRFCEDGITEPRLDNEDTWFFRQARSDKKTGLLSSSQDTLDLRNPFKDYADLTRTFHPTRNGHAAIAKHIVQIINT